MNATSMTLKGQSIAFTGKLAHLTHAEAMTYVRDLGGEISKGINSMTTLLVVGCLGWPMLKNGSLSSDFRKANRMAAEGANLKILSESDFFRLAGMVEADQAEKSISLEVVCQMLGLTAETLLRWEQFDLIHSAGGKYDLQDLVSLRTLMQLLAQGVALEKIRKNLQFLKESCAEFARPLAQLRIIANDNDLLAFVSENRHMTASGQMLFGFDSDTCLVDPVTAGQWFDYGVELEAAKKFPEAIKAYTKAIELDYESSEAMFNLANVYRHVGDHLAAERFYQQVVERAPMFATAWYNLGTIQAQIGRVKSVTSLCQAVSLDPGWIDAHFNLAIMLENSSRDTEAIHHWRLCLELKPPADLANLVRVHLETHGRALGLRPLSDRVGPERPLDQGVSPDREKSIDSNQIGRQMPMLPGMP